MNIIKKRRSVFDPESGVYFENISDFRDIECNVEYIFSFKTGPTIDLLNSYFYKNQERIVTNKQKVIYLTLLLYYVINRYNLRNTIILLGYSSRPSLDLLGLDDLIILTDFGIDLLLKKYNEQGNRERPVTRFDLLKKRKQLIEDFKKTEL